MSSESKDAHMQPSQERRYTTISIPQPLYEEVKRAIEGTGFRSPTEFLVYVTRTSLQSNLLRPDAKPAAATATTTPVTSPTQRPPYPLR